MYGSFRPRLQIIQKQQTKKKKNLEVFLPKTVYVYSSEKKNKLKSLHKSQTSNQTSFHNKMQILFCFCFQTPLPTHPPIKFYVKFLFQYKMKKVLVVFLFILLLSLEQSSCRTKKKLHRLEHIFQGRVLEWCCCYWQALHCGSKTK